MKPDVSIIMLSYNHAPWIDKAIKSVVEQKTKYSFQVIIHDDASTDNSQEIIKKWYEKYPDIIIPILQTENQYSKGTHIAKSLMFPKAEGRYIAICECDDYWIDENKIEKQVSYMDEHPECGQCFSNAEIVGISNEHIKDFYPANFIWNDNDLIKKLSLEEGADFSTEEMILLDFTPTASMMFRSELIKELEKWEYSFDLVYRLVAASMGTSHYFNEVFSAYRVNNPNSASGSIKDDFDKQKKSFYQFHKNTLLDFDKYTNGKYHKTVVQEIQRKETYLFVNTAKRGARKTKRFDELSAKMRKIYFMKAYFPKLFDKLYEIKNKKGNK